MGKSAVKSLWRFSLVTCTALVAAITAVASYAGNYTPLESWWMPMLELVLPLLLLLCLFLIVAWACARSFWALLPLAGILFNWNYLASVIQVNPLRQLPPEVTADRTEANGYLTVASYNVFGFGYELTGYSCKKIAAYMEENCVDVLCFQEFGGVPSFTIDSIRHALSHWPYSYVAGEGTDWEGLPVAVFSRYPLVNKRFLPYPESVNCSVICDVVMGEDTVRLFNNHFQTTNINQNRRRMEKELGTSSARKDEQVMNESLYLMYTNFLKRAEQVDTICRLVSESPHPSVLCGDFNSPPMSYTYRRVASLLSDGFRTCGRGYMYTYRYGKRLYRIDYVFHDPSLEGYRYFSPDIAKCSDHNPVICTVKLNPSKANVPRL